jgi:cation:H+ antiporter
VIIFKRAFVDISLLYHFAIVALGLIGLWGTGDLVVRYTDMTARAYKVTTFFISFVILAIAADIPELSVAITSALGNVTEISVGDLVGANFTDIALVIGLTLFIGGKSVVIMPRNKIRLASMMIITCLTMSWVFWTGFLTKGHGIWLILIYLGAIGWLWRRRGNFDILHHEPEANNKKISVSVDAQSQVRSFWVSPTGLLLKLCACVGLVMIISYVTVQNAVYLAQNLGLSLRMIGATIFAMGTSLPELTFSLNALRHKNYDLAVGATLGTVLEQATFIVGMLSVCSRSPVNFAAMRGSSIFMFLAFGTIIFGLLSKRGMGRLMGGFLLLLYVIYMGYQFITG